MRAVAGSVVRATWHSDASELNDAELLSGLQSREVARADTPQWQLDGRPGHPFIRLNQRGAAVGGKRYMSGFMDGWTARDWSQHYGDTWSQLLAQKQHFDPTAY